MFVLCPHCQFLAAPDPASGQLPAQCPRCGLSMRTGPATDTRVDDAPAEVAQDWPSEDARTQVAHANDAPVEPTIADDTIAGRVAPELETPSPDRASVVADDTSAPAEPATPIETAATVNAVIASPDANLTPIPPADSAELVPAPPASSSPTFVQRQRARLLRAQRSHRNTPVLLLASTGLTLLLALQWLLADRAELARDPRWRPALLQTCGVLRCTLPPWREPAALTLLDRDVRQGAAGVLHVSANFRNDARWPQPWPALLLTLSDVDGRGVGARTFLPSEYLPGEQLSRGSAGTTQTLLASGQGARVSMDIAEPGRDVVAFTFDFR